jgi:hypothetical protein
MVCIRALSAAIIHRELPEGPLAGIVHKGSRQAFMFFFSWFYLQMQLSPTKCIFSPKKCILVLQNGLHKSSRRRPPAGIIHNGPWQALFMIFFFWFLLASAI